MRRIRLLMLVILTALAAGGLFAALGQPVMADDGTAPSAVRADSMLNLQQQTKTERDGTEYLVLVARLQKKDGYPLSERTVFFYEINDVFGEASVPIGSAVTSAAGYATLRYQTGLLGDHAVSVNFPGDIEASPVQAAANFKLDKLPPGKLEAAPKSLDGLSHWTLLTVGAVVAVIWALLLGVLVGVLRGIKRNAGAA